MNVPLVSVIMPAYNAEKYIQQAIDSVLAQTFTSWELIIIDDGSKDGTVSIVKRNQLKNDQIFLIQQENRKQGAARNAGLHVARGVWIAFLDSDDQWLPAKLEIQLRYQDKADVLYTDGIKIYEGKNQQKFWKTEFGHFSAADMYKKLYTYNPLPNLSVMMKKEWIGKIGYQDEAMEVVGCEDWEYWIRLAKNGASFFGIHDKLFIYRIHAMGTSRNRIRMKIAQIYALYVNLDFKQLNKKWAQQILETLLVALIDRLLEENQKQEALKQIRILNDVSERMNYRLIQYLIGRTHLINSKLLIYLAKPMLGLRSLKRTLVNRSRKL
jgi:glycosyltransferase involved in cell wall biosynthesis